jgi:hypothetical protein
VDPTDESVRTICPSHGLQAVEMTGKRVRKTFQTADAATRWLVGALHHLSGVSSPGACSDGGLV